MDAITEPTTDDLEPVAAVAADSAIDDDIDDDLLVEEISIDGMCGVY